MEYPDLYEKNNAMQKRDADLVLEEYKMKINWKDVGERIIDIGSGDGTVTATILRKYVPINFKEIIGSDLSEKNVYFANERYKDDRINFIPLDIEGDMPKDLIERFDHVFSFYVLHWVKCQEFAFWNIYKLMREGGECFLTITSYHPFFDAFRVLSHKQKWTSWLKGIEKFISPYHDSQLQDKNYVKKTMESIGFKDVTVDFQKKTYCFEGVEDIKEQLRSINPFKIPLSLVDDFLDDFLEAMLELNVVQSAPAPDPENLKSSGVTYNYIMLVIFASK